MHSPDITPSRRFLRSTGWLLAVLVGVAAGWKAVTDSVDFPIYYAAGQQVLDGNYELYPAEVYERDASVPGHGYRYLPAIAMLFAGFALLPYAAAAGFLFALKILAFAHSIGILSRRLHLRESVLGLTWVVLFAAGGFLLEEFRGGNVHFLVVYLMLLAFDQSERLRMVLPATAVAFATAVKLTPFVLVAYLAMRKRWFIAASATALLVVLVVAPALLWGREHNSRLLDGYSNYSSTALDAAANDRNYSMRGVLVSLRRYGLTVSAANVAWLMLSASIAMIAALAVLRPASHWMTRDVEFALIMACLPLLSPHAQRIYFSSLMAPAAVLFALWRNSDVTSRLRAMAGWALVSLGATSTVLPLILSGKELSRRYLDYFPYTWGCLAATVALLAAAVMDRRLSAQRSVTIAET